jgi:ribosomal protein L40E
VIILFLALFIFIFEGAIHIGEKILPFLTTLTGWLSGIFFFVLLPLGVFRKTRGFSGICAVYLSYAVGFTLWFYSAIATYYLWGMFALILGIALFGVGVFPMALPATIFKGEWGIFWNIVYLGVLTYGSRFLGAYFAVKAEEQKAQDYQQQLTDSYSSPEPELIKEADIVENTQNFCVQCGKPLQSAANFCRHCGTKRIL